MQKNKKLFPLIAIAGMVTALLYLLSIMLSSSQRRQPNPYEYQIGAPAKTDRSQILYEEIREISIPANRLTALAVDPQNRLYVAADSILFIYTCEGNLKARLQLDQSIHCLAAVDGKIVYAGMRDHIRVYDYAGRYRATWPTLSEQSYLTAIAVAVNYVYAADAGARLVQCFTKQGNLLRTIGRRDSLKKVPGFDVPSPFFDLVVDQEDRLWVVNPGRHEIEQYSEKGDLVAFWGEASMSMQGFCGCCNPTHIALLSDAAFVTSEKGIVRVKVYGIDGKLRAVVAGAEEFDEGTTGLDLAVDREDNLYVLDPEKKCVRVFALKKIQQVEIR